MAATPVFPNPRNLQVEPDTIAPVSDSSVAQSNPAGLSDKSPALPDGKRNTALQYADALTERGAPRDLDNWTNGGVTSLMNDKEAWDEEDVNQRGFAHSKMRLTAAVAPTSSTHNIVQAPDGSRVAFPKGTDPNTMHAEMEKWWAPHIQRASAAWDSIRNVASNAAQAVGLPADMPEWQKASDDFVRDPVAATGDIIGAIVGGLAHGANAAIPNTPENQALVSRAQAAWAHGDHLAAAVTLTPLVGDGLAKAVKQAQTRDYSGALGTSIGVAAPFLTDTFKAEGELPVTHEKPVVPTKTEYTATPDQSGQFGNLQHVVTTKDAAGNVVGHLAAQETAPGTVTERFSHVDEAHQGQGKGTAQIRTLVQETAKNPELHTVNSDVSTTPAARGSWEKFRAENPEAVTVTDHKGTPIWSVDLDKVREQAASASEFNGEERRGTSRAALPTANEVEQGLKTGQPVRTIADQTARAQETINRGVAQELAPKDADALALKKALNGSAGENALYAKAKAELGPEATPSEVAQRAQAMKTGTPTPARAAVAGRSVGAASIDDLETKPDVPTFFSKAEQVINDKVSNNASGDSIKALLQNSGVKADEMKWAGLDDFLKDKPKVSKADLQQFIKENQIQLKDVDLGTKQRYETVPNNAETEHAGEPMFDVIDPKNGLTRFTGTKDAAQDYISELGQGLSSAEEAELGDLRAQEEQARQQIQKLRTASNEFGRDSKQWQAVADEIDNTPHLHEDRIKELEQKYRQGATELSTKYDKWTLPGERENYQEKLLTLPTRTTPERLAAINEYNDAAKARQSYLDAGNLVPGDVETRFLDAQQAMRKEATGSNPNYSSPHWGDEPNVVAHVRFSDRPAVDGAKTLFMEEAQSDWHSAGRHEGYNNPKEIKELARQLDNALAAYQTKSKALAANPEDAQVKADARAAFQETQRLERAYNAAASTRGVPDAPFKQSWHELAMKRMLREAAEKGYDRLAWTTGDQQAALYDLSKHIGRIEYDPENNELHAFDPQGKKVLDENVDPTVKELARYIGQEHAENLVGQIDDYKNNAPSEPDPDWFRESASEGYDIDERAVPDENQELETPPERDEYTDHVRELAEKYGLDGNRVVPQLRLDLQAKASSEELAEVERLRKAALDAEREQEDNRDTVTQYYVTTPSGDEHGPFDTHREAQEEMSDRIDRDVRYEMDNYEAEKPDLPAITNLNEHKGGEFHHLLYDQMIPSFLKKYTKKWGGEVGTTEIKGMGQPEVDYEGPTKTVDELEDIKNNGGIDGKEVPGYSVMQRLKAVISDMKRGLPFRDAMLGVEGDSDSHSLADQLGGKFLKSGSNQKVHSIEITPAMRKSVMKEGQPIAKKDEKKRPFAAPEPQQVAAFNPRLAERMRASLA